ncbi:MAG: hypothetical protein NVSMB6_18170 [Burkholderiaceae bacterium]
MLLWIAAKATKAAIQATANSEGQRDASGISYKHAQTISQTG